jgi:hypothetical protein
MHLQVLQVASRKRNVRDNLDLAISNLLDLDIIAQVARATFDLDAVVQELLECADVEDLVGHRLRAVDGVLRWTSDEFAHRERAENIPCW